MMKNIMCLALILTVMACLTDRPVRAEGVRIGVVDIQRVISECAAGKDVTKKLRQKQDERSSDLDSKKAEITALKKSIEALDPVLQKEELDKKKADLAAKTKVMKDTESKFNSQIRDLNNRQSSTVMSDILRIIDTVGKKGGFSVIIDKTHVFFSGGAVDVSGQVIEEYDMEFQRTR
jgi:outer membrane protein